MSPGTLTTNINMGTSFYEQANTENLWGMFVNAGYLTILEKSDGESPIYTICIPNGEVRQEFKRLTMDYLHVDESLFMKIISGIRERQKDSFIVDYKNLMKSTPSFYDVQNENSVHMFLLGICVFLLPDYEILSNRESGTGRCDIILKAKRSLLPSYVLELKYVTKAELKKDTRALCKAGKIAIKQIVDRNYDRELTGTVVHVGIAQCGKEVEIEWIDKIV